MNKKEFLNILKKKISILNEQEQKDIINEYTDAINEKVKHGQTEEEAVKDFGNIDDLAKEILTAYKIDPDYETETLYEKSNNLIKQWAEKIADKASELVSSFKSNTEINLELVFEIIIKVFITLILLGVLRFIIDIFKELGSSIFDIFFDPVNEIFTALWTIFLVILYLCTAIMIIISMFKQYFYNKETKTQKPNKKEINKPKEKTETKKGITIGEVILFIVKILVILYVIIPFIAIDGFNIIALAFAVIYLIKGINLLGLTILLIGNIALITYLIKLIFNLLFGKAKPRIIPVIISVFLIAIGTIMFIDMIMNIDYKDEIPTSIKIQTETKTFTTDKPVYLNIHDYPKEEVVYKINENLKDGEFIIKVEYPDFIQNMEFSQINDYKNSDYCDDDENYASCHDNTTYKLININPDNDDFTSLKKLYNNFINDLKDNKIYNYSKLYDHNSMYNIEVEASEKTISIIKIK